MKRFATIALGALVLAGAATAVATPAAARVTVGIGLGVGPGYYAPPPAAYCDPRYDPYRCGYSDYYYDPIWFDGAWVTGPLPYRYYGGRPEFFIHGGWHNDVRFGGGSFHGGAVRHGGGTHHR